MSYVSCQLHSELQVTDPFVRIELVKLTVLDWNAPWETPRSLAFGASSDDLACWAQVAIYKGQDVAVKYPFLGVDAVACVGLDLSARSLTGGETNGMAVMMLAWMDARMRARL